MMKLCSCSQRFLCVLMLVCSAAGLSMFVARSQTVAQETSGDQKLRHVVLFKFKESSSKEQVAQLVKEFGELPKKIPESLNTSSAPITRRKV